ncbi:hypothetical protein [Variovorax boronicumulans]|uniref:hypothetical protein n=1 Tax=Variovorax boronicumulans TaxID=436515 RepID=UPI00117D6741|nr:hypothetical protein [Variovorax boronicumulans]
MDPVALMAGARAQCESRDPSVMRAAHISAGMAPYLDTVGGSAFQAGIPSRQWRIELVATESESIDRLNPPAMAGFSIEI